MAFSYTRFSTLKQEQGDSGRRQIESARKYAAERGYILDESIGLTAANPPGQVGISAKGLWMNSLKRIESKTIPRGSILIVEGPDCVSRQRFFEAYSTYQRVLSAGIEIHFLSIRYVLKPEHSFTDILRVGVEIDRANCESVLKSERLGEAWSKKRETCKRQNGHERPRSSLVEAAKGRHIQVRAAGYR